VLWSEEYIELVSTLGSSTSEKNDIILWDMTHCKFEPIARLKQHKARPLHIAMSPDKTKVGKLMVLLERPCLKLFNIDYSYY